MKNRIGEIKESKHCGLMKIIEYNNAKDIKVEFRTGSIVKTTYNNFKKEVKDPLFPSVYKMGYIGIGKHKPSINCKDTSEYKTWQNVFRRCYDPYYINKRLTYKTATVCDEWLNFQNFAEWYNKNYYELIDERVELDKDLIKKGNKVYCPEYCSFVPQSINSLLNKSDKSKRQCTIGVSFHKDTDKYQSFVCINGKQKRIGYFNTEIKAYMAYKKAKEEQIKIMANKYKQCLPLKVYKYLMDYKVEIMD